MVPCPRLDREGPQSLFPGESIADQVDIRQKDHCWTEKRGTGRGEKHKRRTITRHAEARGPGR